MREKLVASAFVTGARNGRVETGTRPKFDTKAPRGSAYLGPFDSTLLAVV